MTWILIASVIATAAQAGDLDVAVRTSKGAAVSGVVVTAMPSSGGRAPAQYGQPLTVAQSHQTFEPFILVVPVGAEVRFPNQDAVKHQVYSFSPAKSFELKLYGRDQSRSVHFDKAGVVALGCNIHDSMIAYIDVVDAPFAARTDGSGHVVLHSLPPGPVKVRVWHPYMRSPDNERAAAANVPAAGTARLAFTVELRMPAMRMSSY